MYCRICGKQLDENSKFCSACGAPVGNNTGKHGRKKIPLFARIILVLLTLILVIPVILLCLAIFYDSDDSSTVGTSEMSQYDNHISTISTSGETATETETDSILVDNENFSVTYIGAQDQANLEVFYVTLRIENKTDVEVFVSVEDADVDGETVQMVMTGVPLVIRPGNSGQTGFIFPMNNLSISSMSEAENATFRIVIRNYDTFDIVAESELVTVDLAK